MTTTIFRLSSSPRKRTWTSSRQLLIPITQQLTKNNNSNTSWNQIKRYNITYSRSKMIANTNHSSPKITLDELISAQYHDRFYADICRLLNEEHRITCTHDNNGLLIRIISTNPPIVILQSLQQRVLVLIHYPVTAGKAGDCKIYCRLKRHLYWHSLAMDCYATVRNCTECARNRIKLRRISDP